MSTPTDKIPQFNKASMFKLTFDLNAAEAKTSDKLAERIEAVAKEIRSQNTRLFYNMFGLLVDEESDKIIGRWEVR